MASKINITVVTGNLTRDPELRHVGQKGTAICEFSVAVNSREKRGDEWQDRVDYFDIKVWAGLGENAANYLAKGSPVAISGKLRQERWETKDGDKRSKVVIVASAVQFLPSKKRQGGDDSGADEASRQDAAEQGDPPHEDDIPF